MKRFHGPRATVCRFQQACQQSCPVSVHALHPRVALFCVISAICAQRRMSACWNFGGRLRMRPRAGMTPAFTWACRQQRRRPVAGGLSGVPVRQRRRDRRCAAAAVELRGGRELQHAEEAAPRNGVKGSVWAQPRIAEAAVEHHGRSWRAVRGKSTSGSFGARQRCFPYDGAMYAGVLLLVQFIC